MSCQRIHCACGQICEGFKVAGFIHWNYNTSGCSGKRCRVAMVTCPVCLLTDGQVEEEEEWNSMMRKPAVLDFDQLLNEARRKLKK